MRTALAAILLLALAQDASSAAVRLPGSGEPTRQMAITVDDLPASRSHALSLAEQRELTQLLLSALSRHAVPAVGFVNEAKLEVGGRVSPDHVALLESWLEAGFELGNHGYAHLDLHRVSDSEWMRDVLLGERVVRPLIEVRGQALRWFRHPFLHTGRSTEVQQKVGSFFADHGYTIAPVTIDNSEWIYAREYDQAIEHGNEGRAERLGEDYLRYMLDVVTFYEDQSEAILQRALPHVLLIHANALNAAWLGKLLERLEARGYQWVMLEQALEDPAYGRGIGGYTGPGGISWLHRWAITDGLDRTIFSDEPRVPEWVDDEE